MQQGTTKINVAVDKLPNFHCLNQPGVCPHHTASIFIGCERYIMDNIQHLLSVFISFNLTIHHQLCKISLWSRICFLKHGSDCFSLSRCVERLTLWKACHGDDNSFFSGQDYFSSRYWNLAFLMPLITFLQRVWYSLTCLQMRLKCQRESLVENLTWPIWSRILSLLATT